MYLRTLGQILSRSAFWMLSSLKEAAGSTGSKPSTFMSNAWPHLATCQCVYVCMWEVPGVEIRARQSINQAGSRPIHGAACRLRTCCPMRPQPMTASVLPASSVPMNLDLCFSKLRSIER